MKKLLWISAKTVTLVWFTVVFFFASAELQILKPEEQRRLKEGKQFWEWNSSYGSLSMHYLEKGEGPNHVLMIHGFRAHTYTWRYLVEPLAAAGYHVWAIDLIGYGLSDKPENAAYNFDFFVQQVEAFMAAKGISNAHLVGSSMGGGLALNLALFHPQRVHSLTLLSALGYPIELPFYLTICKHISRLWPPFLSPRMVRRTLNQIVYDGKRILDEQVEAYCLPYRFPGGLKASLLTLQQYDQRHFINMSKHYSSLQNPILVIWGEHDSLLPVSHFERFLNDFPQAQKLLISQCGHIPQEEAPHEVLSAMLQFLSDQK